MIESIIDASLRNRFLAIIGSLLLAAGVLALKQTPLDAIPDLSDVQAIVFTEYPEQAPKVVEEQVSYPLTTAMFSEGVNRGSVNRGQTTFFL